MEQTKEYKVVTYTDHHTDEYVAYFDDFDRAFEYYKRSVNRQSSAQFTAGAALIRVSTGEPIHRQNWRV